MNIDFMAVIRRILQLSATNLFRFHSSLTYVPRAWLLGAFSHLPHSRAFRAFSRAYFVHFLCIVISPAHVLFLNLYYLSSPYP